MKKTLLLAAFCAALLPATAQKNYIYQGFNDFTWEDEIGDSYKTWGQFLHVSANGKYAVGYDNSDWATCAAYAWTLDDPKNLTRINTDAHEVGLYDVSDDGLMVGSAYDENSEDCLPAVRQFGANGWTMLPLDEKAIGGGYSYSNNANAITPDGKYIAGSYYIGTGEYKTTIFGTTEISYLTAALWERQDDGTYTTAATYKNLGKQENFLFDEENGDWKEQAETYFTDFQVWDITNDGKTIVGMCTAGTGGQNPAFIRDGKLYEIFNCGEEYDEETMDYDEWAETANFNGGIIMRVDGKGNMYGYYVTNEQAYKYFTFTTDNKLVYLSSLTMKADNEGNTYGQSNEGVSYTMDISEDGNVIVGGGLATDDIGSYNYPTVAYDETAGIQRATAETEPVAIDLQGNTLFVNGLYKTVTVYDASGKLVAKGGQGKTFNMGTLGSGVYMVSVLTNKGYQTYKIAR